MTLPQKLEILIRRKGVTKTELAAMSGITYRALANYVSGGRRPRRSILAKLAEVLGSTPEFLLDEKRALILTSAERFAFNAVSPEAAVNAGLSLLDETRRLFGTVDSDLNLTRSDKRVLFSCIAEIYFDTSGT